MTIILAICIPLTAFVVGFLVLKSVQLGLRWQIETKQEQLPTMEAPIKNPIAPIVEARHEKASQKQEEERASILHEYLNGVEER